MITILALLVLATKILVFVVFACSAVVALVHWAVSNRHMTPFNPLARGVRRAAEPLVKPMERALLRRGANPVSAPYALFWVSLLGGLALIGLVQWLAGFLATLTVSAASGPRGLLRFAVSGLFSLLMLALFVRVISSWFSLSRYSGPMRLVFGLTDWLIEPIRKILPPFGMLDFSPLVAYLMLMLAQNFLLRNL